MRWREAVHVIDGLVHRELRHRIDPVDESHVLRSLAHGALHLGVTLVADHEEFVLRRGRAV